MKRFIGSIAVVLILFTGLQNAAPTLALVSPLTSPLAPPDMRAYTAPVVRHVTPPIHGRVFFVWRRIR